MKNSILTIAVAAFGLFAFDATAQVYTPSEIAYCTNSPPAGFSKDECLCIEYDCSDKYWSYIDGNINYSPNLTPAQQTQNNQVWATGDNLQRSCNSECVKKYGTATPSGVKPPVGKTPPVKMPPIKLPPKKHPPKKLPPKKPPVPTSR